MPTCLETQGEKACDEMLQEDVDGIENKEQKSRIMDASSRDLAMTKEVCSEIQERTDNRCVGCEGLKPKDEIEEKNEDVTENNQCSKTDTDTNFRYKKAEQNASRNDSVTQNTHFIYKLYNMLEDDDLKDLIWWSDSGDSFLIRPVESFSKTLSAYFKHTNIASFVRQLNMYGFQKVSDHKSSWNDNAGASEMSLMNFWEFKHSCNQFRKGDKESLKYIKRRSSKYHLYGNRKNSGTNSICSTSGATNEYAPSSEHITNRSTHCSQSFDIGVQSSVYSTQCVHSSNGTAPLQPDMLAHGVDYYNSTQGKIPDTCVDTKVQELQQAINGLRHNNLDLQRRYEFAVDELRATNFAMIKLLDIVQTVLLEKKDHTRAQDCNDVSNSNQGTRRPRTPLGSATRKASFLSPHTKPTINRDENADSSHLMHTTIHEISMFKDSLSSRICKYQESLQKSLYGENLRSSSNACHSNGLPSFLSPPQLNDTSSTRSSYNSDNIPKHTTQTFSTIKDAQDENQHVCLTLNPFERGRYSKSTSKKRHMSVLMDPLAPASPHQPQVGVPLSSKSSIDHSVNQYQSSPTNLVTSDTASRSLSCKEHGYFSTSSSSIIMPELKRPYSSTVDSQNSEWSSVPPQYKLQENTNQPRGKQAFVSSRLMGSTYLHQPQNIQYQMHDNYSNFISPSTSANVLPHKPYYSHGTMLVPNYRSQMFYSSATMGSTTNQPLGRSENGSNCESGNDCTVNVPLHQGDSKIIRPIPNRIIVHEQSSGPGLTVRATQPGQQGETTSTEPHTQLNPLK